MPRDYDDRKEASCAVGDMQLRAWGAVRWMTFLNAHSDMRRDLYDALMIAEDAIIADRAFLVHMIRTDRLAHVSRVLALRRQQNTWRRRAQTGGVRPAMMHVQASSVQRAGVSESDDDDDDESDDNDDGNDDRYDASLSRFVGFGVSSFVEQDPDDADESAGDYSKRRKRTGEYLSGADVRGTSLVQIMSRQM